VKTEQIFTNLVLTFLITSQLFRLLPAAEIWLVAVSLVIVDLVGLLLVSPRYTFEPTFLGKFSWSHSYYAVLFHSASIALALAWWLIRGLPRSLRRRWLSRDQLWIVAVPCSALLTDLIFTKAISLPSVQAAAITVTVQLGVITLFAGRPPQLINIGRLVNRSVRSEAFRPPSPTSQPSPVARRSSENERSPADEPPLVARPFPTNEAAPIGDATSSAPGPRIDVAQAISRSVHKKILLSYRREDSGDVTGRMYDRLIQRFCRDRVFKDVDSIPLGVDFRKDLHAIVENCDVVIAVIGDRWNGRAGQEDKTRLDNPKDYVRIELEAALQRDIPVIPVLVRGAEIPDASELPTTLAALAYRNGLPVRPDPDFHRDMDRLIEGVLNHFGEQDDGLRVH
jgi:hypothetical protein